MNIKHLLTAAAATFVLTVSSVASAADANRNNSRVVVGQNAHHTTITERFRGHPGNVVVRERFRRHPNNVVARERFRGRPLIARTRVVEVLRGRHIRFVGTPYFYGGRYLVRCYDSFGRLAYCSVDPYSGAFLGFRVRL